MSEQLAFTPLIELLWQTVQPDEMLANPVLEARARAVARTTGNSEFER